MSTKRERDKSGAKGATTPDATPHLTVVIKLGSSSILHPEPPYLPQLATLSALAETCLALRSLGHRVVIVSSGAIGMGLHRMELPALVGGKKRVIGEKQALAAIGQGRLIALWDQLFGTLKQPIAQILMTRNDIADRSRYLNATTTLSTLLSMGVIPIINENDTISVSEILHINKFGDNDTLSAIAAGMCGADYLFLLTDVEGLYEDNPRKVPGARLVTKVRDIEEVRTMVSTSTLGSSLGTGGMETKLIAAELATAAGCATVITLGSDPSRILSIVQAHAHTTAATLANFSSPSAPGVIFSSPFPSSATPSDPLTTSPPDLSSTLPSLPLHTLFTPKPRPLTSRRFWILHGLTPRGTVYVDEGAYLAISRGERDGGGGGNGGRLLAAGVLRVEGTFAAGQAVRVCVIKGRWGGRQGGKGTETEPSRPGSPDHFADRNMERALEDSVGSLDIGGSKEDERTQHRVESIEHEDEEILEFGRGLTNYNSVEIDRVKGHRSGGTGAQGTKVVEGLLAPVVMDGVTKPSPYSLRILTRDPTHRRAQAFVKQFGTRVELIKGNVGDLQIIAEALKGAYGAYVNTDGFTIGEAAEMRLGMHIFELAKYAGVRHYVYSTLEYASKQGNFDPAFACEHLNGKARVSEWMKTFKSDENGLVYTSILSGPYLQMLAGGLYIPKILEDGTRVFAVPHGQGAVPLINVDDFSFWAPYIFANRSSLSGETLSVACDVITWPNLVETFKKVTGLPAIYKDMPFNEYADLFIADPDGPLASEAPNGITKRQNFEKFFHYFRSGLSVKDIAGLRKIYPQMLTVEEWMRATKYDGTPSILLKGYEDSMKA